MGTGRIYLKTILSCCIAGVIAFMVVNLGLFLYHRPAGWIDRTDSATKSIWRPGSTIIHGTEGHGVYIADENGYLNNGKLIEDGYTIIVGASFTQGKEVSLGERYTDILNTRLSLGQNNNDLVVYNVSQDGYFFPDIVHGFSALVQEFPNSQNLIVEIGSTDFSADELLQAFDQCGFDESQTGRQITSTLSAKSKLVMAEPANKAIYSFGKRDEKIRCSSYNGTGDKGKFRPSIGTDPLGV